MKIRKQCVDRPDTRGCMYKKLRHPLTGEIDSIMEGTLENAGMWYRPR